MKYVREHINEKFTEDSDPVNDLNIGVRYVRKFKTYNEAANFFLDSINILTDGIYESKEHLKQLMLKAQKQQYHSPALTVYPVITRYNKAYQTYDKIIYSPLRMYKDFFDGYGGYAPVTIEEAGERFDKNPNKLRIIKTFSDEIKYILNISEQKNMNEVFTQNSDPIRDMNIGAKKYLKDYELTKIFDALDEFELNMLVATFGVEDLYYMGSSDVDGDNKKYLKKLETLVKNGKKLYTKTYRDLYSEFFEYNAKVKYTLYETSIGKIATMIFSNDNQRYDIKQYIGDLNAAASLDLKNNVEIIANI